MSFAYIDSQGKEVPIPGPDALRLRIELGAITDSTQFYDEGSDRWAPASEHEIYRQLKREISASQAGGFMAPPPSAIGPDPASADPLADDVDDVDDVDATVEVDEIDEIVTGGEEDDPSHDELLYPEGASAEEIDLGMDTFTLSDPEAASAPYEQVPENEGAGDDAFDFGADALTLEEEGEGEDEIDDDDVLVGAGVDVEDAAPAGPTGNAPLVGSDADEGAIGETPDFGMAFEGGAPDDPFDAVEEDEVDEDAVDEDAVDEEGVDEEGDRPEGVSSHAEAPDRAVSGVSEAGGAEDSESGSRPDDPYRRVVRERRGPRSSPSGRSARRGSGSGGGARTLLGVLLGAGAVAAVAWLAMGSGGGEDVGSDAGVVLPALPGDLDPQLRELARAASERMVAEFDSLPQRVALAPQPGPQWLSGAYLANADDYQAVRDYWQGFEELLGAVIASEDEIWATEWELVLDSASLAPGVESQLRTRGLTGWSAAAPERAIVHDQLRGVIDAALGLHAFLVTNESAIAYDPGSGGGAGDPVLEAVPDTPELGDEMWRRVGEITVALDALGYLEQVETEPLFERVKAKLVATGIR